jgi:MFS family permease
MLTMRQRQQGRPPGPASAISQAVAPGLRANWPQLALLVAVTAFVGGMAGLERAVVPLLAEREFGIRSSAVAASFLVSFGLAKALSNLYAGHLAARFSRRRLLIGGWLFAVPVPFMIIWAPAWSWVIAANALLGVQQGLTWSMTINMHVDLAGPRRRGLALGLNETAGYAAVAGAAFFGGVIAEKWGMRPAPFYLGVAFAAAGLALSLLFIRDTGQFAAREAGPVAERRVRKPLLASLADGTWRRPDLFALSQAGFVKNLNDGMAWGVLPVFFASKGLPVGDIAGLAAAYPLTWGVLQVASGSASDRVGRRALIVTGMVLQAGAIAWLGVGGSFGAWLAGAILLGAGTAMVYPTLLAAVGDAVTPDERPAAFGVYRFWRDSGTLAGALLAGALADKFGHLTAIETVAGVTAVSGLVAAALLANPAPGRLAGVCSGQERKGA